MHARSQTARADAPGRSLLRIASRTSAGSACASSVRSGPSLASATASTIHTGATCASAQAGRESCSAQCSPARPSFTMPAGKHPIPHPIYAAERSGDADTGEHESPDERACGGLSITPRIAVRTLLIRRYRVRAPGGPPATREQKSGALSQRRARPRRCPQRRIVRPQEAAIFRGTVTEGASSRDLWSEASAISA